MTISATPTGGAGWLDEFHAFSTVHLLALVTVGACAFAVIREGLRFRDSGRIAAARFDASLAAAGAAAWITVQVWWLAPARFTWGNSLPLQLCDLAGFVGPIAIWTSDHRARALLYFWGLGLSTQGLLTPLIREGPAHAAFWMTWLNHGAIVTTALYDLAVRKFRPRWRHLGFSLLLTAAYALCMFTLDALLGWNYAYLGRALPTAPSLADTLGPWPMRAFVIMVIGALAMTMLMLPWRFIARAKAVNTGEGRHGL